MSDNITKKAGQFKKAIAMLLLTATFGIAVSSAEDIGLPAAHPAEVALSAERLARIETIVKEYVDRGQIPGAVYGVARNGRLAHINSIGAMHDDTIFRFYSMTKPITVVAVLQLYEEGRFLLTDPVARYLPEFTDMQVYVDANTTRSASAPITIEDLLTHTAGLSYNDDTIDGVPKLYAEADLWTAATLGEFTKKVAALPLVFDPGTKWHYSVATDVLGRLVEVASGQSFDEYLQQRVLGPLQMSDTAFFIPESKVDRFTPLYRRDGEGMTLAETVEESRYLDANRVPFGGSGLVSTANDYLRFMQMLLNDGELNGATILGRKTVELMMMDHLGPNIQIPREPDAWLARTENRSGDLNLGLGHAYGGYVIVDVAENDVPGSVGTYSWGGAASTYFFVDRKEQLAAIFLTQLTPSSSYPIRAQFRGLVYQAIID